MQKLAEDLLDFLRKYSSDFLETEEQHRRAEENGYCIYSHPDRESFSRNQGEQFVDYATALKNGLEWTHERAMYGLLRAEREKN